ncbi:MAG: hypothetical protein JWN89_452 [Parcubacteria group bacterium]|nr:hypothetical protein [Parcubacteria group bacterium]
MILSWLLTPAFLKDANSYPHFLNKKAEKRFGRIATALLMLLYLSVPSLFVLLIAVTEVKHPPILLIRIAFAILFSAVIGLSVFLYYVHMGPRFVAENRVIVVDLLALIDGLSGGKHKGWADESEIAGAATAELAQRISAKLNESQRELNTIVTGWHDLKIERPTFMQMSWMRRLVTAVVWALGFAFIVYGVALAFGYIPRRRARPDSIRPSLDTGAARTTS